jgi:hypothetical protein
MALWVKLIWGGLGLVGVGLWLAIWFCSARWNDKTAQFVDKLTPATLWREARTVTFRDFEQLPPPVARYFRMALKEGQPMIRSVQIVQSGEFRKADDGWSPFEATQYFSTQPPGFVWDAIIRMAPLMKVRVRDAYVAGQGSMQGKILSLMSVVDEGGKTELNAGALQRYLAEAVWFPTALLPSKSVKWSPIDNSRALATLTDSGTIVSLEFHFSDAGEITGVFTPSRYREVDGKYELTPWEGHFRHYEERGGIRIPIEGYVEWRLQDGSFPYWKGRIIKVMYDFADDLPPVKKTF